MKIKPRECFWMQWNSGTNKAGSRSETRLTVDFLSPEHLTEEPCGMIFLLKIVRKLTAAKLVLRPAEQTFAHSTGMKQCLLRGVPNHDCLQGIPKLTYL